MSNTVTVSSAWTMSDTQVSAGHVQYVFDSGLAETATVLSGATQFVYSGGTAKDTLTYWTQHISSGGTAINTVDQYRQFVSSGGTALNTVVRHTTSSFTTAPALGVYTGGYVSGVTIEDDCLGQIQTQSAYDIKVLSGGVASVYDGGLATGVSVASGGNLLIVSGGVRDVDVAGTLNIRDGYCSGLLTHRGASTTLSNGTVEDAELHWVLNTFYGATITSRTLRNVRIYNAYITQSARCAAYDITLMTEVTSGVSTGHGVYHMRGGTISGITISSGGSMYIGSGGLIENVTLHSGGIISGLSTTPATTRQISTVIVSGGYAYFSSGAIVNDLTVNSRGYVHIGSGGTLTSATVHAGGALYIRGVGSSLTLSSGASTFYISAGGTASGVTCDVGVSVISGGSLWEAHGFLYASGYVSGANIRANTANVVYTTGSGTDIDVYTTFSVWGYVTDVRVHSGRLTLDHGGVGSGIVLYSGTTLLVVSACSALAVTSNAGAHVIVYAGGYIEYVTP